MALEWLVTNGLGDFACGTVAGPNTRRQHGLFTASGGPAGRRMLLLAALDVALERGGERHDLSCHRYVGMRHPEGFRHCAGFRADPFPEWRYELPGAVLAHRIFMPHGKRCVVSAWTLDPASSIGPWRLRVRPLFAYREADTLTAANDAVNMSLEQEAGAIVVTPYPGCPRMFLCCVSAEVHPAPQWYYHFQHPWDVALGLAAEEDLFSPCEMTFELAPGKSATLAAGLEPLTEDSDEVERRERQRQAALALPAVEDEEVGGLLSRAAEAFVVRAESGTTGIVVGYPACGPKPFGGHRPEPVQEICRNTLIALPGLLLCSRRLTEAGEVIGAALDRCMVSEGPDALDDTPLWLIRAGEQYVEHSRDWDFLRETLSPGCEKLAQRYLENRSGVGFYLAPDGLLASESGGPPLTWMDAHMDGWPVTPRNGKPVEVNALWHHALALLSRWTRRRGQADEAERFAHLQDLCGKSFRHRFWNGAAGCLFDVVDPGNKSPDEARADLSLRPNQLLAVSLPSDLLERSQATATLSFVEKRLLTPRGLRTLSLEDPRFQPRYGGAAVERAAARHQGSVFPWLIGAYADAVFRVHGRTPRACARVETCLEPLLRDHLREGCLGQCSELFDGASPNAPRGDFAHAPAVAELIRAYVEVKGRSW